MSQFVVQKEGDIQKLTLSNTATASGNKHLITRNTNLEGLPRCCCKNDPEARYVYFQDCCETEKYVKMTVEHWQEHILPREECNGFGVKFKFPGRQECYSVSFVGGNDTEDIVLLTEEEVIGTRCIPYVHANDGGQPWRCNSLPQDCPECEDPPDCCIRTRHGGPCNSWLPGSLECVRGTRYTYERRLRYSEQVERWTVVPRIYSDSFCDAPFPIPCRGNCLPEELIEWRRINVFYNHNGECRRCYRGESDYSGIGSYNFRKTIQSTERAFCGQGSLNNCPICTPTPTHVPPCDADCGWQSNDFSEEYSGGFRGCDLLYGTMMTYDILAPWGETLSVGPKPFIEDTINCTRPPGMVTEPSSNNPCQQVTKWFSEDYTSDCNGARKITTFRLEVRWRSNSSNPPYDPCWPNRDYHPSLICQACPEAVGKLVYRITASLEDEVGTVTQEYEADEGSCERPTISNNAVVEEENSVSAMDMI